MLAKDIMHKRVVTVTPKTTLRQAAELFGRRGISGAPVVGAQGRPIGMISQTDLIGLRRKSSRELRVEQAMTPWAVSFEEDTPVLELARQMLSKRIHRVVITRAGEISGIVTSMDMLRALLKIAGDVGASNASRKKAAPRA